MRAALLLLVFSAAASAESMESSADYVDLWQASLKAMAAQPAKIVSEDRAGGTIRAEGAFPFQSPWFRCEKGQGSMKSQTLELVLTIRGRHVEVIATGKAAWFQRKHFIFITYDHLWNYPKCVSTGVLERGVIQQIRSSLT